VNVNYKPTLCPTCSFAFVFCPCLITYASLTPIPERKGTMTIKKLDRCMLIKRGWKLNRLYLFKNVIFEHASYSPGIGLREGEFWREIMSTAFIEMFCSVPLGFTLS